MPISTKAQPLPDVHSLYFLAALKSASTLLFMSSEPDPTILYETCVLELSNEEATLKLVPVKFPSSPELLAEVDLAVLPFPPRLGTIYYLLTDGTFADPQLPPYTQEELDSAQAKAKRLAYLFGTEKTSPPSTDH